MRRIGARIELRNVSWIKQNLVKNCKKIEKIIHKIIKETINEQIQNFAQENP